MDDTTAIQNRLWELGQATAATITGIVMRVDWPSSTVAVNVGSFEQSMPWLGPAPWPGDRVRVLTLGKLPLCGLIEGSAMGTAQTSAAGVTTAAGDDGETYRFPHLGAAPAPGARVRIDHAGRCIVGPYAAEPAGSQFIPPAAQPGTSGRMWFDSVWGGNWRFGSFAGDDVTVSDNRTAAYGWASMVGDTIPDAATVTVLQLHLSKTWESANTTTVPGRLGTHSANARPGSFGDGNLSGSLPVGPDQGVVDLLGFATAFKTGAALGVGFISEHGWRTYAPTARIYAEWS